ncbi:MAG: flippase-like domain-containing protein [Bacteroidales bacterium]|nr:flippase-like domain-containing protein [Bacteroidales bacterium]
MKKKVFNIIKYLLFFLTGAGIFWFIYRDFEMDSLKMELSQLKYGWIALSLIIGLFSHYIRAIRWKMLIKPLGYEPRTINLFGSVMIMYLANLLLPRAGEVARCTVLTRYEKVPFTKLVGTVAIERLTDLVALLVFAFFIILSQLGAFNAFLLTHAEMRDNINNIFTLRNISIVVIVGVLFIGLGYYVLKSDFGGKLGGKVNSLKHQFVDGIKSIRNVSNIWLYVFYTVLIYVLWLYMSYVIFFAYGPTGHLTLPVAMITFVMSGLAMVAPVQGGIGPWHFMVYETLFIYGIEKVNGKTFALISHTSTQLALLFFGALFLVILPIINNSANKKTGRYLNSIKFMSILDSILKSSTSSSISGSSGS